MQAVMPNFSSDKKVIPVIRLTDQSRACDVVSLHEAEGINIFEITLTTPGALEIIATLSGTGQSIAGAGTVLSRDDARESIDAGARFIVSAIIRRDIADICIEREVPCFLGAATPTEVLAAHKAGTAAVKVFPAAQLGGPGFLKAVKSVFPHIALMPTGGIGSGDLADYFAAGACCIGMGGRLVDEQAMNDGRPGDISKAAWEVLDALAAVNAGNGA